MENHLESSRPPNVQFEVTPSTTPKGFQALSAQHPFQLAAAPLSEFFTTTQTSPLVPNAYLEPTFSIIQKALLALFAQPRSLPPAAHPPYPHQFSMI